MAPMTPGVARYRHSRVVVAPFLGEFGWEVMCWQGYLRSLRANEESTAEHFVTYCRAGHELLYRDFSTQIIPVSAAPTNTDCWVNRDGIASVALTERTGTEKLIVPEIVKVSHVDNNQEAFNRQMFIPFGDRNAETAIKGPVIFHARDTAKCTTGYRNWPADGWAKLVAMLKPRPMISVGTKASSAHVPGTVDCRGQTLDELAWRLSRGSVLIGPSSGPMHFGALCGIPIVVWSGEKNEERYRRIWNPFRSLVGYIEETRPKPERVMEEVERFI